MLLVLLCLYGMAASMHAQIDSFKSEKVLEEVIISLNKWEQKLNEVPNRWN